jgi:hypothetical protein
VGITPHKNSKASMFSYDIIPLPSKFLNIKTYEITNAQEILFNLVLIVGSSIQIAAIGGAIYFIIELIMGNI